MPIGRPPIVDLKLWTPADIRQMRRLRDALVDNGTSRTVAARLVVALDDLRRTGDDGLNAVQRTRYRKELARLGEPPWADLRARVATRAKGAYSASSRIRQAAGWAEGLRAVA